MNGFLVVTRFTSDDVPRGFFATLAEASEFAENLDVEDVPACLQHGFSAESYYFVRTWIIEFADGVPVEEHANKDPQPVIVG